MESTIMPNGNNIYYSSKWIESIAYQYIEHYNKYNDMLFGINVILEDAISIIVNDRKKLAIVNLEHKAPIDEYGQLAYCSSFWTNMYNDMVNNVISEVWDFQIENFEYYRFYNIQNKFRFRPLRYTTWFDKYKTLESPKYEVQLECVIDTDSRIWMITQLTNEPYANIDGTYVNDDFITVNLTNTNDSNIKFNAKNLCKYGIDCAHYDSPCTINCTRIYEYVCMNKPVIVWDRDLITSRKYFGDLCYYLTDFNGYNIKQITKQEPRKDIAETFKQMTYSDNDYYEYCLNIIRDYKNRIGITVPDYVMYE